MNINEELLKISNISVEAGRIILDFYNKNLDITFKADESPLTQADLASNKITDSKKIYTKHTNTSEEEFIEWDIRKEWKKYWLIDPLDGTKEFIKKNGEFTVNISLIENNRPILGVIYAPASNELYFAKKNFGSYKILTSKQLNTLDNATKISIKINKTNKVKIIGSRSHSNPILQKWVSKNFNDFQILQKGSSLKFCLIAEGFADIYPRFGPTSEWDIAQGILYLKKREENLKALITKKFYIMKKKIFLIPILLTTILIL